MLAASLSIALAVSFADEATEIMAVRAAMDRLGEAFVAEDVGAIKMLITSDHIAIGPTYEGPVSIDEQIAVFRRITLTEWIPTEPTLTLLAETVAMRSFELSLRGAFDDIPLHSRAYVTEIWVKRDDRWLQYLYQQTVLAR